MSSLLLLLLFALIGGLAAGLQGPLAGIMGRHVGIMGSVFLVHLGGAAFSLPFLIVPRLSRMQNWQSIPWYSLIAGSLGLVLLGALAYCIPRLGVANTLTLVVVGQMSIAIFLDHFGYFADFARPVEPMRILGLIFLLIGTWCIVK